MAKRERKRSNIPGSQRSAHTNTPPLRNGGMQVLANGLIRREHERLNEC